jgi:hypothetical protein
MNKDVGVPKVLGVLRVIVLVKFFIDLLFLTLGTLGTLSTD